MAYRRKCFHPMVLRLHFCIVSQHRECGTIRPEPINGRFATRKPLSASLWLLWRGTTQVASPEMQEVFSKNAPSATQERVFASRFPGRSSLVADPYRLGGAEGATEDGGMTRQHQERGDGRRRLGRHGIVLTAHDGGEVAKPGRLPAGMLPKCRLAHSSRTNGDTAQEITYVPVGRRTTPEHGVRLMQASFGEGKMARRSGFH